MPTAAARPLGLLGGTFDPVHNAHLALADCALRELGLSAVRWIPSGRPGHRAQPGAAVAHRLAMLRLALEGDRRFSLDEADALSGEPVYTIDTLARLRRELGASVPLVFIIGADQFLALDSWRQWQRLFEGAHFAVAERPGYPLDAARLSEPLQAELAARTAVVIDRRPAGSIVRFAMPPSDISASAIRAALSKGHLPAEVLPPKVLAYIRTHHLYMEPGI